MKKLSIFAVTIAALAFTACGGNKNQQATEQTEEKSFEQEQVEAKVKMEIDSLSAEIGKLKKLPFLQTTDNGFKLTDQEKQAKPDYLLDVAAVENATTLAEKYRLVKKKKEVMWLVESQTFGRHQRPIVQRHPGCCQHL